MSGVNSSRTFSPYCSLDRTPSVSPYRNSPELLTTFRGGGRVLELVAAVEVRGVPVAARQAEAEADVAGAAREAPARTPPDSAAGPGRWRPRPSARRRAPATRTTSCARPAPSGVLSAPDGDAYRISPSPWCGQSRASPDRLDSAAPPAYSLPVRLARRLIPEENRHERQTTGVPGRGAPGRELGERGHRRAGVDPVEPGDRARAAERAQGADGQAPRGAADPLHPGVPRRLGERAPRHHRASRTSTST